MQELVLPHSAGTECIVPWKLWLSMKPLILILDWHLRGPKRNQEEKGAYACSIMQSQLSENSQESERPPLFPSTISAFQPFISQTCLKKADARLLGNSACSCAWASVKLLSSPQCYPGLEPSLALSCRWAVLVRGLCGE